MSNSWGKKKKKLTTMYEYIYLPVCYMIYPCFGHTGGKTEKAGPRFESSQILVMMNDGNFYRTCRKIRERERERARKDEGSSTTRNRMR